MPVLCLGLTLQLGGSVSRLLLPPDPQTSQGTTERQHGKTSQSGEGGPVVLDSSHVPGEQAIDRSEHGH